MDFTLALLEEIAAHQLILDHMDTSRLVGPLWPTQRVQDLRLRRLVTSPQVVLLRAVLPEPEVHLWT